MMLKYDHLTKYAKVFKSMTGLSLTLFDEMEAEIAEKFMAAEAQRLSRPERERAIGGGREQDLAIQDQVLMAVVWLRCYPKQHVLAYLYGVSESSVSRVLKRVLPLLEQNGRDTMKMPDPGRKRRKELDELLKETPELAVVIDSFEQRVQRPQDRKESDAHYSGKKKQTTLKVQVAVDEETGHFIDVSASIKGPTPDIKLLESSKLLDRLPKGIGAIGDLAYKGIEKLHPSGAAASPRRKPREKARPPEDIAFNQAFARRRIIVEHTIGLARRFEAITQMDRHHRKYHSARVMAVCGLVNRRLTYRHRFVKIA
jgi:DDE superfamily endonuclease/Helix-turn-helix of DDE superfamily endonuclease